MKFADLDLSQEYSYADYLTWTFKERLEIIKGKVFKMGPAPSPAHQRMSREIFWALATFLKGKTWEVYTAPFDVRLPNKSKRHQDICTVVQPDLCVVCDPGKLDRRGCFGAPDIVVEILSPGNNQRELIDKYAVYEESGVREYWLVLVATKVCFRYVLQSGGRYESGRPLIEGDVLSTPVLPGFELDLGEAFRAI